MRHGSSTDFITVGSARHVKPPMAGSRMARSLRLVSLCMSTTDLETANKHLVGSQAFGLVKLRKEMKTCILFLHPVVC